MTDSLLILCLGLTVAAAGLKYRIRLNISRFRKEIGALTAQRLKAVVQRKLAEEEFAYAKLKERELTNDCRDLSRELQHVQSQLQELQELAESRSKRKPESAEEEGNSS